jgi:hypothetical protein
MFSNLNYALSQVRQDEIRFRARQASIVRDHLGAARDRGAQPPVRLSISRVAEEHPLDQLARGLQSQGAMLMADVNGRVVAACAMDGDGHQGIDRLIEHLLACKQPRWRRRFRRRAKHRADLSHHGC